MSCPHGHIEGDCDICIEVEAAFDNGYEQGKAAKNSPKIAEVKAHSFLGEGIEGLWITHADYRTLEENTKNLVNACGYVSKYSSPEEWRDLHKALDVLWDMYKDE